MVALLRSAATVGARRVRAGRGQDVDCSSSPLLTSHLASSRVFIGGAKRAGLLRERGVGGAK